ncbi:hypothetical protein BGZ96_001147 [Linnemannia gamsii]|uniref:Uncharacterized protein n=1 Tax=Linnemannia gamsii TaxID=64522 RepID=A0ABQ7JMQ4_9FUNG|nr:hypothetical protein BGZ96_001147 [Linnemannia gamsii]
MSSTSSLLTLPSVDEPLELTKTAPILDPKIPFFKYLDLLTAISQNALSFRQQAYESFLALNPHLAISNFVPSISWSSGHNLNMRQQPVKVDRKIETLLKSSMILLQRYCLVIQVSLPKLPSFRRRTHGNSLKAYEVRATGYLEDLKQYQEEGGLLYLQACFVRYMAAQRDLNNKSVGAASSQVGVESGDGVTSVPPQTGEAIVTNAPLNKSVPASVKSTVQEVPEPSDNSVAATAATPHVVGVVKTPSKSKKNPKKQSDVPVIVPKQPPKIKNQLSASAIALEQPPKSNEQLNVPTVLAESTLPSQSSHTRHNSGRSSRRKKLSPERQGDVEVEETSSNTYTRPAEAPVEPIPPPISTPAAALTSTALWKLERDLEKLNRVQTMMEEQITKSSNIRARGSKLTKETTLKPMATVISQSSVTAADTSMATTTPIRLNAAALSQIPTSTPPVAAAASTTVNARPSTVVIPAGITTVEKSKRAAKVGTIITPAVTLTVPTPPSAGTPFTSPKPLATRGTVVAAYNPPRETAKSTNNKRMSPGTSAIRGSGAVRNLIRQYETPSSASSNSSQSDLPDLQLNRKRRPTTLAAAAVAAAASLTTPAGAPSAPGASVKSLKTAQTTSTTTVTAVVATPPTTAVSSTISKTTAKGIMPGSLLHPRKDALFDLGDKQNSASASGVKTRPAQDLPIRNRDSIRATSNINESTSSKPFQSIVPPVISTTPTSSTSYSLSKARSAIAKSALTLESHQPTHTQGQLSREQPTKPRTAAEAVKYSYLLGSQAKAYTESLQVPGQEHPKRTRPSLNGNNLWNNPPPPSLSQTRKMSSSSVETVTTAASVTTVFRAGADGNPAVAWGDPTFAPSDPPQIESCFVTAAVSEVNLSNRSSRPISTSSKAMSFDESIKSWRRDVPVAASSSRLLPLNSQEDQISTSADPITNRSIAVGWLNEAEYVENDEDDGQSHIDLIRIPTMSSTRSTATASTTRTIPFSSSSPLGSRRFTPRHRSNLSSALAQGTLEVKKSKEGVQVIKKKSSGYVPDTDESETETANLQYLEVPPARGTQAWLEMRTHDLEQEREEAERRQHQDGENDSYPEYGNERSLQLEQPVRCDSKYLTMRVAAISSLRQTSTSSRPQLSQVRFDFQDSFQSSPQCQDQKIRKGKQELPETPIRSGAPSFTKPFKADLRRSIQQLYSNSNTHQDDSQRPMRKYASTDLSSSTCSVRQPAPSHSVSPASSAFASIRGTPAPSTMAAPSVKSFATGSTTTLRTPISFLPPSLSSSTSVAAPRSHHPTQGQTDDGNSEILSMRVRKIRAQEASVLGSMNEPVLGSLPRQMNVERAATLVRNGSDYCGLQLHHQQQQQQQQQR